MKKTFTVLALTAVLLLSGCGKAAGPAETAPPVPSPAVQTPEATPTPTPTPAADVRTAADALVAAMQQGDFAAVAQYVSPTKGVTFTPYSFVDPGSDRCFTAAQVAAFGSDNTTYLWGAYDGSGNPMQLTPQEYWNEFVWNADYTQAPDVTVNDIAQSGLAIENVTEAYPDATFVEYHFGGLDEKEEGLDWCALKLVFEQSAGQWQLIGIIHSQWVI